jgi:hypothetical protein
MMGCRSDGILKDWRTGVVEWWLLKKCFVKGVAEVGLSF